MIFSVAPLIASMRRGTEKKGIDPEPLERLSLDPNENIEYLEGKTGDWRIRAFYFGYDPEAHGVTSVAVIKRKEEVYHLYAVNGGKETRKDVLERLLGVAKEMVASNRTHFLLKGYPRLKAGQFTKESIYS